MGGAPGGGGGGWGGGARAEAMQAHQAVVLVEGLHGIVLHGLRVDEHHRPLHPVRIQFRLPRACQRWTPHLFIRTTDALLMN